MKLTVLVDNNTLIDHYYYGEPGLCYYIEDEGERILWDSGYSHTARINAQRLGIDLSAVTTVAISHGHNDHTGGLVDLCQADVFTRPKLVAHPQAFAPKRDDQKQPIGASFTPQGLSQHFDLAFSAQPVALSPHITFLGEIPRITAFEAAQPIGETLTSQGWRPDTLIDDTALVYESPLGLYIITACSHSGIANICEYAKKVTGTNRIRGIIGGMHLFGPSLQLSATIAYCQNQHILELYPCHCVDFAAKAAIHAVLPIHEVGIGTGITW